MSIDVRFHRYPTAVLALLAVLLTHAVAAQAPTQPGDTRITNVEIIATDSKGQHLAGLTRDDFELYENGKLQPITNLTEASAETARNVSRSLVFYLDDSTLLPNNRKLIIPAMKQFVADTMKPGDRVMIVTFNQSAKTRLPWTGDLAAVQSGLDSIAGESGNGRIRQTARKRMEDEIRTIVNGDQVSSQSGSGAPGADFGGILAGVRNYATAVNHDFALSAGSLADLFESLADVDGRKIVFIASEALPTRPGSEAFAYLESVRNEILSGHASPGLQASARSASVNAAASEFNTNETIRQLSNAANASGVTIYALDPDASARSGSGTVEQSAPGQMPAGAEGGFSGVEGLQILAQATGGLAWIGAKPAVALEKVRADLQNYYSIGYSANLSGDAERVIEVKPKRADIRVRAKKSIVLRTAESEMSARVTSNLQSAQRNDLGISLKVAGEVVTEGDKRRVPMHVMIPARNLNVLAEGDVMTGGFSVYVCTGGGETKPSDVNRQSHDIRWPPAAIAQLGDRQMTFALEVVLEKGRDQISVGVLDHRSQTTGFAKIAM
jgi:VWFA-related protein